MIFPERWEESAGAIWSTAEPARRQVVQAGGTRSAGRWTIPPGRVLATAQPVRHQPPTGCRPGSFPPVIPLPSPPEVRRRRNASRPGRSQAGRHRPGRGDPTIFIIIICLEPSTIMGQTNARQAAIAAVAARSAPRSPARWVASIDRETPVRQLFGVNVFSDEVMRSRLPETGLQGPPGHDQEGGRARPERSPTSPPPR